MHQLIKVVFLQDIIIVILMMHIYAVLTHTNTSSTATVRYDAFALFDEVIVFENNTGAYVKF